MNLENADSDRLRPGANRRYAMIRLAKKANSTVMSSFRILGVGILWWYAG